MSKQFEIIGNGNPLTHFYPLGTVVTRITPDDDGTAVYSGWIENEDVLGDNYNQWVGDADVKEIV